MKPYKNKGCFIFRRAYGILKGGIFMKFTKKGVSAALLACVALTTFSGVQAAFDEHLESIN